MILELGILGPILWLVWTSSLVFAALKTALRLKGTWAFPVAISILWFAFILLFPFTWVGTRGISELRQQRLFLALGGCFIPVAGLGKARVLTNRRWLLPGPAKTRIAVVSPFLDKQHGTERCVVEQVERLARDYEVHVYSNRVEDIDLSRIVWHRVPRAARAAPFRLLLVAYCQSWVPVVGPAISVA